jgi:hypothetical protein
LLLAAAHAASGLFSPFGESRKEIIARFKVATDVRARLATQCAKEEILLDGQGKLREGSTSSGAEVLTHFDIAGLDATSGPTQFTGGSGDGRKLRRLSPDPYFR